MTVELLPCGTMVKTKLGSISGMITASVIRFDKLQYEISYFHDGEEKTVWMNEAQFTTEANKTTIGFKNSFAFP
jgi:hypothetical protein